MQRLITVGLGYRDVILEFAGERLVKRMQCAERDIAGWQVFDDNAKAVNIENLGEGNRFFLHFFIDRRKMFFAAGHVGFKVKFFQPVFNAVENFTDHFTTVAARGFDRFFQHRKTVRVQEAKAQILEFIIDRIESQPICDG